MTTEPVWNPGEGPLFPLLLRDCGMRRAYGLSQFGGVPDYIQAT
jgi:hypothetical protein